MWDFWNSSMTFSVCNKYIYNKKETTSKIANLDTGWVVPIIGKIDLRIFIDYSLIRQLIGKKKPINNSKLR